MKTKSKFLDFVKDTSFENSLHNSGMFYADFTDGSGLISKVIKQFGYNLCDMSIGKYKNNIHPDDMKMYLSLWNRLHEGSDDEFYCEYRLKDQNNKWIWILTHATVLNRNKNGSIHKIIGFDRIISGRKKTENILLNQLNKAKNATVISKTIHSAGKKLVSNLHFLENLNDALEEMKEIVDFDSCILFLNEGDSQKVINYPQDETINIPNFDQLILKVKKSKYPILEDNLIDGFGSIMSIPLIGEEEMVGVLILLNNKRGAFNGSDMYPVMAFVDILTLAIINNNKLNSIIGDLERDHLTGFLTRKSFENTIPNFWDDITTNYQENVVCIIDIDHFKKVNDTYGHQVGDDVIRELGIVFKKTLRDNDILGRYGGDEFIVILPNTELSSGTKIMDRLRLSIQNLNISGLDDGVTISIGICNSNGRNSIESIIKKADYYLYQSKNTGRNKVVSNSR